MGITTKTLREWLKDPRKEDFAAEVRKAESSFEIQIVSQLKSLAECDAKALQWILERRFPTRWNPGRAIADGDELEKEGEPRRIEIVVTDGQGRVVGKPSDGGSNGG